MFDAVVLNKIWDAYQAVSMLEWSAVFMTVVCVFLAGKNSVHTWWTGIIACTLYGFLFYGFQLYADATLQIFFVITGAIGWYGWANVNGGYKFNSMFKHGLEISRVGRSSLAIMLVVAIAAAIAYGLLLKKYTNAYAPMIDSLVLTLSIVAQLLLMRRKLENWPLWIAVNTLAVPLYWSRELYPTAIMYAVFWAHAWYAWWNWYQIRKSDQITVQ